MNESVINEMEQNEVEQQETAIPHVRPRTSQRSRRRQNKSLLTIALVAVLAVVIVVSLILGLKGCAPKPTLEGRWNLDGTTIYEFYEDGKGALILTTMTFEFNYTVDGDVISIDFIDDRATDAKYECFLTEEFLMLTGGPNDANAQHILKREK